MYEDYIIVTNNQEVRKKYGTEKELVFLDADIEAVMIKVRDLVYAGHELLSHPLSGSVKPGETPYKSVLLAKAVTAFDEASARMIENAISTLHKFHFKPSFNDAQALADFRLVDLSLITNAITSADV